MDISPSASVENRQGFIRRLWLRLADALPAPNVVLFGSVLWGVLMTLSAVTAIWLQNGLITGYRLALVSLYFYGGALGFAPGLWLATALVGRRGRVARFVVGTIIILLATHTATSGVFALQYRAFYSYWHASFPSVIWFFQFSFTSAGAVYQYTVDSLYYYWPLSVLCFLGFGLWFARSKRPLAH